MEKQRIAENEIATPRFEQVRSESGQALPPGATQANAWPGWLSPAAEREPHRRGDLRAR